MDKKPFPCCDLLTEARLDGEQVVHNISRTMRSLANAVKCGDYDGDEDNCRACAKEAKEEICTTINNLMKMRDKITFWQAWASDNSPLN